MLQLVVWKIAIYGKQPTRQDATALLRGCIYGMWGFDGVLYGLTFGRNAQVANCPFTTSIVINLPSN